MEREKDLFFLFRGRSTIVWSPSWAIVTVSGFEDAAWCVSLHLHHQQHHYCIIINMVVIHIIINNIIINCAPGVSWWVSLERVQHWHLTLIILFCWLVLYSTETVLTKPWTSGYVWTTMTILNDPTLLRESNRRTMSFTSRLSSAFSHFGSDAETFSKFALLNWLIVTIINLE